MDKLIGSPYMFFNRTEWESLRMAMPLPLSEDDLIRIHGINEKISLDEISQVYLPISRLLNLYVLDTHRLYNVTNTFLGTLAKKVPYIIGIAGSVAVGKSTTGRIIQELLKSWPTKPRVDLVTTDSFLYPNAVLKSHGIMMKKGFPESYDLQRLMDFLKSIKSGCSNVKVPIYSHSFYDIIPDEYKTINAPDILIVEGLNILQIPKVNYKICKSQLYISDFLDFSIYVHADSINIKQWYIERFQILRRTAFQDKTSYFNRYAQMSEKETKLMAGKIWDEINGINLEENIHPTMRRARLIIKKGDDHTVQRICLRKL